MSVTIDLENMILSDGKKVFVGKLNKTNGEIEYFVNLSEKHKTVFEWRWNGQDPIPSMNHWLFDVPLGKPKVVANSCSNRLEIENTETILVLQLDHDEIFEKIHEKGFEWASKEDELHFSLYPVMVLEETLQKSATFKDVWQSTVEYFNSPICDWSRDIFKIANKFLKTVDLINGSVIWNFHLSHERSYVIHTIKSTIF